MQHFSYSDLELAKVTKQGQHIFKGHKQSLCQNLASNHFSITRYGLDRNSAFCLTMRVRVHLISINCTG